MKTDIYMFDLKPIKDKSMAAVITDIFIPLF